ncbi:hypothetical protein KSX_00240 [Ktedonospora formicarum]|uniref:non-specific serine/threonine protein kinase n=2 Tax=Ktedonospora formicarum TaxID=2778364 RepID=A0A8J3MPK6_9CHLR|nr:hypothetical protein KSX_00240 [Ktedonospora formicarum]
MIMRVGQDIGNYRLLAEISHGESAIIYQAVHRILTTRLVALKVLYTAHFSVESDQEDFFREAYVLAKLEHPHILPLIDANIYAGLPYIITEFAAHGSLRSKLNRRPASSWSMDETLVVLRQVGEALHFAHQQNIVHSDIKPENILFRTEKQTVLADFDIARVLSRGNAAVQSLGGTFAYMAPEQFHGKVRKESDQYALGCLTYELLTGRRPYRGEDQSTWMHAHLYERPLAPTQVHASLSPQVDEIIFKAIAKKYSDRYKDIPSFLEALTTALQSRRPSLQAPFILKDPMSRGERDSAIYNEKTEIVTPEDEGPIPAASRKRRTTKATTTEKAGSSKAVRTASVKAKVIREVERKKADPTEEKKPTRKSASLAKTTQKNSDTVKAEMLPPEKKAIRKKDPASKSRKTSVGEKQTKATAGRVSATKKPGSTRAKSQAERMGKKRKNLAQRETLQKP